VRAVDLAVWRADIARNAEAQGLRPVLGPVKISCNFIFHRPKSAATRQFPHVKPDLDKLIRAVLDGLTGVAYDDDSQVVLISAAKTYGNNEGVWVEVAQVGQ
jgi:crossover junction endodeoxyribonuclease RusA